MGLCELGHGTTFAIFVVPAGELISFCAVAFGFWVVRPADLRA